MRSASPQGIPCPGSRTIDQAWRNGALDRSRTSRGAHRDGIVEHHPCRRHNSGPRHRFSSGPVDLVLEAGMALLPYGCHPLGTDHALHPSSCHPDARRSLVMVFYPVHYGHSWCRAGATARWARTSCRRHSVGMSSIQRPPCPSGRLATVSGGSCWIVGADPPAAPSAGSRAARAVSDRGGHGLRGLGRSERGAPRSPSLGEPDGRLVGHT